MHTFKLLALVLLGSVLLPGWACRTTPHCENSPETPTTCGAACTNVKKDSLNCGDCGVVCQAGTRCLDGACLP